MFTPLVPWLHSNAGWQFWVGGDWFHSSAGWQFWATGDRACSARVIEFRVPANFQAPRRRWLAMHERGKLIEFPLRGVRKSA